MTSEYEVSQLDEQLKLTGGLAELARVPAWIAGLASQYSIPEQTSFAIDLCLEEALANILFHGYQGDSTCPIIVSFSMPAEGRFEFIVEDEAPLFNPLEQQELPAITPESSAVGGQGIRLMREFAESLKYEPTPSGNRLKLNFAAGGKSAAQK